MTIKIAPNYSAEYLQVERPRPLSDRHIENAIQEILDGAWDRDITDQVYEDFKNECQSWLFGSALNQLSGIESFPRRDIIIGCTQFIDSIYMQGPVQTVRGDYRYHERLSAAYVKDVGSLIPVIPLIIAMPFPQVGAAHQDMAEILRECELKHIPVHIDGAWISCCRDIEFDFDHPQIHSVGMSLSKGLGLGWNRIGLRWTRSAKPDAISIMNDFNMNCRALAKIGLYFLRKFPRDYLWQIHSERYYRVCRDFALTPTNSIYLALRNNEPVGVAPLIRYLEEHDQ